MLTLVSKDSVKISDHFDVLCVLIACMVLEIINQMSKNQKSSLIVWNTVVCIHQKSVAIFGFILFSPGDGQFTAPPPTCPGDTFTFRCNVTGDRNGDTRWKVGGSSECILGHSTPNDPRPCGSGSPFTVTTGTGFGTNATSFSSTLSGTAIPALDGTLVECFDQDVENMVGNSTLQILGQ